MRLLLLSLMLSLSARRAGAALGWKDSLAHPFESAFVDDPPSLAVREALGTALTGVLTF